MKTQPWITVVAVLAVAWAFYGQFLGDKAKTIRLLKCEIRHRERVIADLRVTYNLLQQEDEKRLAEINQLKTKLEVLRQSIQKGQATLAHVKNDVIGIDEALDIIIGQHTPRSRDVPIPPSACTGSSEAGDGSGP